MPSITVQLLLVAAGSAVGGVLRFSVGLALAGRSALPAGTLAVNLVGSFLMAGVMYAGGQVAVLSPPARLALATGVLGGFTTYSAFAFETLGLLHAGQAGRALFYVLVTVLGCGASAALGWVAARSLLGP